MLISGIVSVTFREKSAEEIIALCLQNGLKAVEWGENAHVFAGDVKGSAALKEKTLAAGLRVAAYGSYYRCEDNTDFAPSLKSAEALGAPVIRIWAGTKGSDCCDEEYFNSVAKNAASAAEMAAAKGIRVAFEWHRNTLTDTNSAAKKLLEKANHENLYTLWQPTPEIPFEERAKAIAELGGKIEHFHVYHWGDDRQRLPFDEAAKAKWKEYFAAAHGKDDYYALMEFVLGDSPEQFARDAAAINDLLIKENANNG